ncbi:hypothetical protein [uncultured Ellagibacter sp.]|uniref:hypothetical protein n=1 Tax=uncultured Ellagibacter sp. TaxID=2137580 RepID=UPI0025F0BAE9|nr:hypothetical protein [uncultured Ellagibacter sp.]
MLDKSVESIVDRAIEGESPCRDEMLMLMGIDVESAEAAYVRWGAEVLGRRASGGVGQIYAQIGLDATPCPENCAFCSLAARNNSSKGRAEVPDDEITHYAGVFDEAGVHLISLMATAAYNFEHFLRIVATVRGAIANDMPLMANIGDITFNQAQQLKAAGIQAIYHAHRLGEGTITGIAPERRLATIASAQKAGLALMTAVEPIYQGIPLEDIADRMLEVISQKPYCSGVGVLTAVPGTTMANETPYTRRQAAYFASIMRLAAGTSIPFGTGCGNVVWTDAGANPRGRDLSTDPDFLRRDVRRLRKELARDGWDVPARPLSAWFK